MYICIYMYVILNIMYTCMDMCKVKRKVHPITGHEGPEVDKSYSFSLSLTSALDGVGVQRHAPVA